MPPTASVAVSGLCTVQVTHVSGPATPPGPIAWTQNVCGPLPRPT